MFCIIINQYIDCNNYFEYLKNINSHIRKRLDFTVHHTFLSINYFLVNTNDRMLKYLYLSGTIFLIHCKYFIGDYCLKYDIPVEWMLAWGDFREIVSWNIVKLVVNKE